MSDVRVCYTVDDSGTTFQRPSALPDISARRVLLFGGTFDPPHVGHLAMAQLALEQTGVDEVWFLPSPSPPHKADIGDDTFSWRLKMVETLLDGRPGLRAVPLESFLPRPSYSVDTVRACQNWYTQTQFFFLLGTDSLAQLPTWHGAEELSQRIAFYVARRSGHPFAATLDAVQSVLSDVRATAIEMPLLDVSSTWIRERLEKRLDVFGLVPPLVLDVWNAGP
ncbi:nicotinate (nicotinamide) nucleotide adenylyltransferase [Alicyclobacillus fastidiosus]|uniref:Probable nicotinate-nucleotide adenylyltransferase n=1 Tax=Alicyclobacillus fastidiosus TaxID=392011 RepID=A0ABY6ZNU6_9BACL|nr:nicotinate (nicotinamide) nucleotide adenylyltransferase [Alicyclobacillus fastidiosus]WAH43766.1 nicotinate (nicotinamide) nucleotide adenylyltransferase [Alicyclobacillus fastidiosus]GMA59986.1 putative nicotinate-nucleotide adenylyltransferase [Alicyclobacillus fastidiosus]